MKTGGSFLVLLLPSFVLTLFGHNVSRDDTWMKANASAFGFELFRERFHRGYEVNSHHFHRRLFFFQVGGRKVRLGSCSANTLLCLRSAVSPALFTPTTFDWPAFTQTICGFPWHLLWAEWMLSVNINPPVYAIDWFKTIASVHVQGRRKPFSTAGSAIRWGPTTTLQSPPFVPCYSILAQQDCK